MSKLKVAVEPKKLQQVYLLPFVKSLKIFSFFGNDTLRQSAWMRKFSARPDEDVATRLDRLHERRRHDEVLELVRRRSERDEEPGLLWRKARALFFLGSSEPRGSDARLSRIVEAHEALESALLSRGDEDPEVHKWMAIVLDERSGLINLRQRLNAAPMVKYHLRRACDLNPRDFEAHYMLGTWYYQLCRLNWVQKLIAKYLITCELPNSSYKQAYKYLLQAHELRPRAMLSNVFFLGDTCFQIGHYFKARYYLNMAVDLKPRDDEERRFLAKALHLIKKLDRYDLSKNNVLFYNYESQSFNDV
ncbi:unnamed protein product [Phyllotreta striolata]|uniref:Regulator of microtubule dynamics protein 1 n=1 Tax=Phyllotreta striolata TaxID=444603 RepID=A0A9N9XR24_PHYSR|nr:unnamed protein product [Phyllotreta striolata]